MNLFCRSTLWTCLFTFLTLPVFPQGPLTPPGPPGPTMKTLDQTEPRTPISSLPFTITRSGSYYVTSNLVATANTNGITVATNTVTIDLNGFALLGAPGNMAAAITALHPVTNITVRNGMLQGWNDGLYGFRIYNGQFLNLQVSGCTNTGIYAGSRGLVRQCSVLKCGTGFILGDSSTATDCIATENEVRGFMASSPVTLFGCSASYNKNSGFFVQAGAILVNCKAHHNTNGFSLGASSAMSCLAYGNSAAGIYATAGSTVRDCNSGDNYYGILVGSDSRVVNNTVTGNASAGIYVEASDNTIDGNHVTDTTGTGLLANPAPGNIIIRNTLSGNTANFNVAAANVFGPVITSSAALTNASPWANFAF